MLCSLALVASRSALVEATSVFTPPTSVFTPEISPVTALICSFCSFSRRLSAAFCSRLQLGGALRQFLLGHAGLAGQGFFLRFRRLHAILQFFDLGLADGQVLRQLLDRGWVM